LWKPAHIAGTSEDNINRWGKYGFNYFLKLFHSQDAAKAGVKMVTSYNLKQVGEPNIMPMCKEVMLNFELLNPEKI
jgi:hypothetical protein